MKFPFWIAFFALFLLTGQVFGEKYAPVSVPMKLKQVSERVYYVQGLPGIATDFEGFISNAGVIISSEGVIVIDALGTPSLAWRLRQLIKEKTDLPVVKVIATHYHADHIYGLQVFKEEGAEIIAPLGVGEYLASDAAKERLEERRFSLEPWVNGDTYLVDPDVIVEKDTQISVGDVTINLDFLGSAHSNGDISLFIEPDQVLFTGDIIFEGRIPWVGDADTKRWLAALDKMAKGELKALIPGHGPAAAKPKQALAQTRDYLAYLREKMGHAAEELIDFDTAYNATDWSRFEKVPAFDAAHRRNAYQVYLTLERESMAD